MAKSKSSKNATVPNPPDGGYGWVNEINLCMRKNSLDSFLLPLKLTIDCFGGLFYDFVHC